MYITRVQNHKKGSRKGRQHARKPKLEAVVFIIGVIAVVALEVTMSITGARRIDAIAILCIGIVAFIVLDGGAVWSTELRSIGVGIGIGIATVIIAFDVGTLLVTEPYYVRVVRKMGRGRVFCV
ncbi:hypothetical protein F5887DRAFT_920828 [Amanita rubescens]|nr:hypothetical protein F5887DRAFT_920828 [Amanita rubescens]